MQVLYALEYLLAPTLQCLVVCGFDEMKLRFYAGSKEEGGYEINFLFVG